MRAGPACLYLNPWSVRRSRSGEAALESQGVVHSEALPVVVEGKDHDLVFTFGFGTLISRADLITRFFKPLLKKKAGLPDIRFRDLRHTCAALLLGKGVHTKLVQDLLGHSSVAVTLDTYSHVLPVMDDGLADTIDAALG